MTSPIPAASPMSREFLVQRLVADAKTRNRISSRNNRLLDHTGNSAKGGAESEDQFFGDVKANRRAHLAGGFQQSLGNGALMQNPMHYAATLASLAQMNLLQPSSNTLPFMYPHLYQSLLTFPDLEKLRLALQSPAGVKSPVGSPMQSANRTPEPLGKTISTPSPRKRGSSTVGHKVSNMTKEDQKQSLMSPLKKPRAIKRLTFDDETASPVSGMHIKEAHELPPAALLQAEADLDDSAKFVEVTDEVREELAKIPNVIGDYICRLCKVKYDDAFKLAQHKCPRIIHEEYRCPECDKVFSCPANLASHRRWHKPKGEPMTVVGSPTGLIEHQDHQEPLDFSSPENLDKHNRWHKVKNGETTVDSTGPIEHQEPLDLSKTGAEGTQLKPFCARCAKRFDSATHLALHETGHLESKNPPHRFEDEKQCPENGCMVWCPNGASLEKHRKMAHPQFSCKFCAENLSTSPALTRHINKYHPNSNCRIVLLDNTPEGID